MDSFNTNDNFDLKEEIIKYLTHWKWFVFSCILSVLVAYFYLRYQSYVYQIDASILIKDNNKSGISEDLAAFADLGIIGGSSMNNTDNEIEIIRSRKIIGLVVDSLKLNCSYFKEGRIKSTELYENSPINVEFLDPSKLDELRSVTYRIEIIDEGSFVLSNSNNENPLKFRFGQLIDKNNVHFRIIKSKYFNSFGKGSIILTIRNSKDVIFTLRKILNVRALDSKMSSIIRLSINQPNKLKGESILNEIIRQYNQDGINDQNLVSEKTIRFIDQRLVSIGESLKSIQDLAQNYKQQNKITGLTKEGEIALELATESDERLKNIETQLKLAKWVNESVQNSGDKSELLPQNLGFSDESMVQGIENYNKMVLTKKRLEQTAGEENPMLIKLKDELILSKRNLKKSILNLIQGLNIQKDQIKKSFDKVNSKISLIPVLERGYIDIARQQEIVNSLYTYLLKKKEETSISLAITVPNAKIIDSAYANPIPISPKKKVFYIGAVILGFLVPFVIIYISIILDTKVHSRRDLEDSISIPFVGDIPHTEDDYKIVVKENARSSSAEAFRLLRTNLNFLLSSQKSDQGKVIFTTSTTSGEGKSLVSMNLAATLSLANAKVLLLGMDLRAPKITEYLEIPDRAGITNYITRDDIQLEDLKFKVQDIKNLDIIASGVIPPNPAELLLHHKVDQLFEKVKKVYDYIIVDTAPVNLVTDTLLISKYADVTLYIVRANYLDKRMLVVPQTLYNEKKLNNMAIVLNDTDMTKGYGYGYGYGYGNGYGYGYVDTVKKPWWKKIFKG